jgi:hypothetical protein
LAYELITKRQWGSWKKKKKTGENISVGDDPVFIFFSSPMRGDIQGIHFQYSSCTSCTQLSVLYPVQYSTYYCGQDYICVYCSAIPLEPRAWARGTKPALVQMDCEISQSPLRGRAAWLPGNGSVCLLVFWWFNCDHQVILIIRKGMKWYCVWLIPCDATQSITKWQWSPRNRRLIKFREYRAVWCAVKISNNAISIMQIV